MQPQYGKWVPKKQLTRGQKKLMKKKAGKQQKIEMEEMNLQIEQVRQKQELIDEILQQPEAREFESLKGFTGEMLSFEPTDYSELKGYGEIIATV